MHGKKRRGAFERSLRLIREHNAEADAHGFRLGVNEYADLDDAEFKALLGNRPGTGPQPSADVAEELRHGGVAAARISHQMASFLCHFATHKNGCVFWGIRAEKSAHLM